LTERTIPGRRSPLPAKGKALYVGQAGKEVLIEQLALGYYREQGYDGLWSENDYWWQLMTLLYWDVVFARLPNVYDPRLGDFPSRLQDIPRDMFSAEFYSRRRGLIEARHAALSSRGVLGLGATSPESELRRAWGRHKGKTCRFFDKWQKFRVDDLALAARSLTHRQLVSIMTRLLQNFNENRRGLPDLFLARAGGPLFVEVKAEREKVEAAQQAWHKYLAEDVGVGVEVCRVVES
jgi:Fanconi-associated nuclease 1